MASVNENRSSLEGAKLKRRMFQKEGESNISFRGIKKKKIKYLKDIYITFLDLKWRWVILILFIAFFVSNMLFAALYYGISYIHGDFNEDGSTQEPCLFKMENFLDAILFSIETQSTIGYGFMSPNADCIATLVVVFLQVVLGFMLETILLGFFFVKIARPKCRRHTLIFSHKACICMENKHYSLQIRVGDIRSTHLIDTHLHGILVRKYVTAENNVYPLYQIMKHTGPLQLFYISIQNVGDLRVWCCQVLPKVLQCTAVQHMVFNSFFFLSVDHEIQFEAHGLGSRLFLFWPMIMSHRITPESPLYSLAHEDLSGETFELVVILEGIIESTGEMVQAKTSYTPGDIQWGYQFDQIEAYDEESGKWYINFTKFNDVIPCEIPRFRAGDFQQRSTLSADKNKEDNSQLKMM